MITGHFGGVGKMISLYYNIMEVSFGKATLAV